jgi:hypothetical protein
MGAEACMQGYVALLGLGMTLIKNQSAEVIPRKKNTIFDFLTDFKFVKSFI